MKKTLALIAAIAFALAQSSFAGLQTQTDTNYLAAASTNTYILSGDVTGTYTTGQTMGTPFILTTTTSGRIDCSVGGYWTNSTANSSNVTYRIAASVDGVNWTNSYQAITLAIPGSTTNYVSAVFQLSTPYPMLALRAVENANAASVSANTNTIWFKAYTRNGF